MTKIQKAIEIIRLSGKDEARRYYQEKLDLLTQNYNPSNFLQLCEKSGLKSVLKFIEYYKED